jgi:phytoene dehydrogenase-like protein
MPGRVELDDGSVLTAHDVVMATDGAAAATLLPAAHRGDLGSRAWKATRLVAFAADRSPLSEHLLVVSGERSGPIDNLTVPSDVAGGYAPPGAALVTVSVRSDWAGETQDLPEAVRRQAEEWFGAAAAGWRHLTTVNVPRSLPDESPAARRTRFTSPRLEAGLWICGDHCATASINGALASGRRCAEAIVRGA